MHDGVSLIAAGHHRPKEAGGGDDFLKGCPEVAWPIVSSPLARLCWGRLRVPAMRWVLLRLLLLGCVSARCRVAAPLSVSDDRRVLVGKDLLEGPCLGVRSWPKVNRIDRIFISTSCNFFSGSSSKKTYKLSVRLAWSNLRMGDRLESVPRVCMSEDKVRRKD
jgi:hypothetical protein